MTVDIWHYLIWYSHMILIHFHWWITVWLLSRNLDLRDASVSKNGAVHHKKLWLSELSKWKREKTWKAVKKKDRRSLLIRARKTCAYLMEAVEVKFLTKSLIDKMCIFLPHKIHWYLKTPKTNLLSKGVWTLGFYISDL